MIYGTKFETCANLLDLHKDLFLCVCNIPYCEMYHIIHICTQLCFEVKEIDLRILKENLE